MNTKKNNSVKPTTSTASGIVSSALDRLNRLYREIVKGSADTRAAMNRGDAPDVVNGLIAAQDERNAAFKTLRRSLPELKFDDFAGEYYPATDSRGREVYRIRVTFTLSETFEIATVDGEEQARRLAEEKMVAELGSGKLSNRMRGDLESRNVSRNA